MPAYKSQKWSNKSTWSEIVELSNTTERDADEYGRRRYLEALRSPAPGQYLADRLRQDQRLRGLVYNAVDAFAKQAVSAERQFHQFHDEAKSGSDQDNKTPLPRNHPCARLFDRPNPQNSFRQLFWKVVQQLKLTGTSLLWKVTDGLDRPVELWSVPTGTATPLGLSSQYPDGAYRVMPFYPGPLATVPGAWTTGGVVVDAKNIVTTRLPSPLVEKDGYSPLDACDQILDTLEMIDRARMNQVRRGAHPSSVMEIDPNVKYPDEMDLERIRAQSSVLLGGPERAGAIAVLGPGQKLVPYASSNIEAGWIETYNQLMDVLLGTFGVTKSLTFTGDDTNYAGLYAALKQFNMFSLQPFLDVIADSWNLQLVWPTWGDKICLSFDPPKVDDEAILEQQLTNDLKCGARTINEIRVARGYPEVPWGETRAIQVRETEKITTDKGIDEPTEEEGQREDNLAATRDYIDVDNG